jgi:nonsense-mediated mRNA decay protein 3
MLPKYLVDKSGQRSHLALCLALGKKITFVDPLQGNLIKIDGKAFWAKPFGSLMGHKQLKRFVVISKELTGETVDDQWEMADFEITDEDSYETRVIVRSHLGRKLSEGDVCICYDLRDEVLPDDTAAVIEGIDFAKVVIVGKARSVLRARKRRRKYLVKKLAPIRTDDDDEFDDFLDELEGDADLRHGVTFYCTETEGDQSGDPDDEDIDGTLTLVQDIHPTDEMTIPH